MNTPAGGPGDRPSFDERVEVLAPIAYRVCFRILGDRHDAQDLTQEALARAFARWRRVARYDEAWITRVATNLALGEVRRRERSRRPEPSAVGTADVDALVTQRAELVEVLRTLSRRQREVVTLRYLADLPEAEVARALGCSIGSVKQHTSRGLAALRAALGPSSDLLAPTSSIEGAT
ncbi:MAG: RNA polymerase sigma factor [Acidimicrobiales bacterium]